MGFVSTVLGFCGFGVGLSAGIVIGYFLFIYFQPSDVKVRRRLADLVSGDPIIADNAVKYKLDSVEFETFTLGSLPPTFQGGGFTNLCHSTYYIEAIGP
ncbi:hypothetical protein BHE74_00026253 [Ensete ventricosum]|nr:hypothetical protein BHE74_00026253 [Ensete ventricosum]RZS01218.1 hypothetical protein BHM03_00031036 [Ensete ventricosum]